MSQAYWKDPGFYRANKTGHLTENWNKGKVLRKIKLKKKKKFIKLVQKATHWKQNGGWDFPLSYQSKLYINANPSLQVADENLNLWE